MRHFMDYVQNAFSQATGWNPDSSYSALNATSDALLAFPTPRGIRLTISSLATPHFATSYQLGSVGLVDGSISYLFSSVPLAGYLTPSSARVALSELHRAYRPLTELGYGIAPNSASVEPKPAPPLPLLLPRHPMLLYGRMYLPRSILEALVVARISSSIQLRLSAVSSPSLKNGGTMLGMAQYDMGRYAVEGLASSDGGLLGLRGVYNFGGDLDDPLGSSSGAVAEVNGKPYLDEVVAAGAHTMGAPIHERERIYGRFTIGGEVYYGTLNKSGGVSVGARFATLPANKGTPLTATVTINPLMGTVTATYAVVAGQSCSLATRLDFNVYSYDSCLSVGMELWRQGGLRDGHKDGEGGGGLKGEEQSEALEPPPPARAPTRSFEAKMAWRLDPTTLPEAKPPALSVETTTDAPTTMHVPLGVQPSEKTIRPDTQDTAPPWEDEHSGVLKARLDQTMKIGLVWEGRIKSLLCSVGGGIDLRKLDRPFRTLGLEIQFSS